MIGTLGWTDWGFEPTVTLGLLALSVGYALALRRGALRADDDVSPWFRSARMRPLAFAAGIAAAYIALQSPIDRGGDDYLLSIHMVQHLLLMLVAPPLLLLGICGMRPAAAGVAARARLAWALITRPWPATLIFTTVLLVWHIPTLYDATLTTTWIHIVEHITFIAVGIIFWWPVVDPLRGPTTGVVGPFPKIAMLVLAGVPPTALGLVLAMSSTVFYSFYARAPRLWGISASNDQTVAGVIMLGVGNLIDFAALSIIFLRMFASPESDEDQAEAALRQPGRMPG